MTRAGGVTARPLRVTFAPIENAPRPAPTIRHRPPTATAPLTPTMHARRLQSALKTQPSHPRQMHEPRQSPPAPPAPQTPTPSRLVCAVKNTCHRAAMLCGAMVLPSMVCLIFGPIGLAVPAALLGATVLCLWVGGKPTAEMQATYAIRASEAREYDPR